MNKSLFYKCLLAGFGLLICIPVYSQSIDSVIQRRGQPSLINQLPNGNTIYVFMIRDTYTPPPTTNTTVIVAPGGKAIGASVPSYNRPSYSYIKCTLTYQTNRQGTIVQENAEGPDCR